MNILVPDELFACPAPARDAVMLEVAITFLRNYWISPCAAAGLAGIGEPELLQLLTDRRISTHYNANEVREATQEMRKTLW